MNRNKVVWLGGALILLAGVAWLAGAFDSDFSTLDPPRWNVEPKDVSALDVYAPDDTLTFRRDESGRWRMVIPVADRADSAAVARTLADLSAIAVSSVVTSNPDRYGKYGVDSSGTRIVITEKNSEKSLVLGNAAARGSGSFVRLEDDPRVFVAAPLLTMTVDSDRWRDRTIVSLPASLVSRVVVTGTENDFDATRGQSGWNITSEGAESSADSASVARWIARFSPLRGDSFVDDVEVVVAETVGALSFHLDTGTSLTLDIRRDDGRLLIARPNDGVFLSVSSGRQQSLLPDRESLSR